MQSSSHLPTLAIRSPTDRSFCMNVIARVTYLELISIADGKDSKGRWAKTFTTVKTSLQVGQIL